MADNFLGKIRVAPEDFVDSGRGAVLESHEILQDLLTERAGPEVAALFAEPLISRGNDAAPPTVSWYTALPGEPRPLSAASRAERERAETYLADHLRPLRALTEQADSAALAFGALSVYGQNDVLLVGDRPVIVNWGLLPGGGGASVASRPAHFETTLGRYLSLAQTGKQAPAAAAPLAAGPDAPAPAQRAAPEPPIATAQDRRAAVSPLAWVPLLVLLLLAAAVLAWLLTPGSRLLPRADTPPAISDAATLAAARELNDSLRARQAGLQTALQGAVCRPDGILVLPGGLTPEGLTPPPVGTALPSVANAAPDAVLPSNPARVLVPGGSEGAGESLLDMIEARTVLVLANPGAGKVTTGSGLAIGPGLFLTNQHVIEPAMVEGGRILVAGGSLTAPQVARVLKATGPLLETGADFALLQVDAAEGPAFPVHVPAQSLRLTNVVAAGYPGDVLATDVNYKALLSGDGSAVPGLTVTDGIVNTEQQMGPNTRAIMHSAALSGGNSGGPLVDMCGRLIGVNSFVRKGRLQNRGFALSAADMMAFLEGTPAAPTVETEACAPVVTRAEAVPAAPD
ncbi:trypsin-like peptidase domain-containing protein [Sedimentitalea sp. JM2-8]|uniref:Trypsin-like peptidase domain-containing protein n=1 Tax=Sedimentitalea xiamensis TaxID=3050037 RepID=A0ABT7FJC3_9RHOB|nr:trypsin-like peptidase domain-containing protein [Sedimentitalea xiamensis]MDK3075216.1 trypsin-like peptidase domain-containing protein [Sedimentitalea xiamensis]